jgi:hypothetical protein
MSSGAKKRGAADIASDYVAMGAVLVAFVVKTLSDAVKVKVRRAVWFVPDDKLDKTIKDGSKTLSDSERDRKSVLYKILQWGLRFTEEDCWLSWKQACGAELKGKGVSAWKRFFFVAHGVVPKDQAATFDDWGRETTPQLSHRCHNQFCCNPVHLIIEPAWLNKLRNGCSGPLSVTIEGRRIQTCGCHLQFACIMGGHVEQPPFGAVEEWVSYVTDTPCLRPYKSLARVFGSPENAWQAAAGLTVLSSPKLIVRYLMGQQYTFKFAFCQFTSSYDPQPMAPVYHAPGSQPISPPLKRVAGAPVSPMAKQYPTEVIDAAVAEGKEEEECAFARQFDQQGRIPIIPIPLPPEFGPDDEDPENM